jgi:hypothetical protein
MSSKTLRTRNPPLGIIPESTKRDD